MCSVEPTRDADPAVMMRGVVKRFPGVVANDGVDFTLRRGEVHAVIGENGAGKTTLMNILSGVVQPDEGVVHVRGRRVRIRSPRDAERLGIAMVHQELMLAEALTVAENIALGLRGSPWVTRWKSIEHDIARQSTELGIAVEPSAYVWQLSVGQRQRVEILRALMRGAQVLLLDEPTAVLGPRETLSLFESVKKLVSEGRSVVLVSHKLDEVTQVADRFTVLRGGRVVASGLEMAGTTQSQLAELMVGRTIESPAQGTRPDRAGDVVLEVRDAHALSDKGVEALSGVRIDVRAGEILGVAGVAGNGQRELADVLSGMRPLVSGQIRVSGQLLAGASPTACLEAGLAYVPEDRRAEGAVVSLSVAENLALKVYRQPPISGRWGLSAAEVRRHGQRLVDEFGIRAASVEQPAGQLSGGNLQRLILARELSGRIKLLVAAQPTRGLDVGAAQSVHELLLSQRERGTATLLISEDLSELMQICDRLVVLYRGRIAGCFVREQFDREVIGQAMGGLAGASAG